MDNYSESFLGYLGVVYKEREQEIYLHASVKYVIDLNKCYGIFVNSCMLR